jgi:Domain of unknown function (DUF4232)
MGEEIRPMLCWRARKDRLMTSRAPHRIGLTTLALAGVMLAGTTLAGCSSFSMQATATGTQDSATSLPQNPQPAQGNQRPSSTSDNASDGHGAASGKTTGTQPAQVARCHTSQLSAELQPGRSTEQYPGAAMLSLHNKSKQTCTMEGYPGISLVAADGRPLSTNPHRDPNEVKPAPLTLAPGSHATNFLSWTNKPGPGDGGDASSCEIAVAVADITPPGERDSLTVTWFDDNTQDRVCNGGTIEMSAFSKV